MDISFGGKVALVTGAGGGIGYATAQAFAQAGASVVLADFDAAKLEHAISALKDQGLNIIGMACDVSDREQVRALLDLTVSTHGRLDAAFNCAGINTTGADLAETEDEVFDHIIAVNLKGVWNCMKAELRQMQKQGTGYIVNCSSVGGLVGSKGRAAYSASKHGVIGLTRSASLDYASTEIRVNAVCPGIVDTPMAAEITRNYDPQIVKAMLTCAPIGRFGRPEEIAAAVLWLCSPAASFMVGHALAVDGGVVAQ